MILCGVHKGSIAMSKQTVLRAHDEARCVMQCKQSPRVCQKWWGRTRKSMEIDTDIVPEPQKSYPAVHANADAHMLVNSARTWTGVNFLPRFCPVVFVQVSMMQWPRKTKCADVHVAKIVGGGG